MGTLTPKQRETLVKEIMRMNKDFLGGAREALPILTTAGEVKCWGLMVLASWATVLPLNALRQLM